jgi:hypothetical protein
MSQPAQNPHPSTTWGEESSAPSKHVFPPPPNQHNYKRVLFTFQPLNQHPKSEHKSAQKSAQKSKHKSAQKSAQNHTKNSIQRISSGKKFANLQTFFDR